MADAEPDAAEAEDAALEGGSYEVIRQRLLAHGRTLKDKAEALNEQRKQTFGGTEMAVLTQGRVRTENNCVPRDIVEVDGQLVLGFNVHMGLKLETSVGDVFSVHAFPAEGADFEHVPLERVPYLADETFAKDFNDVYRYYRDAALLQLRATDSKLLAVFQIGASHEDLKVFRWGTGSRGLTYVDNRGERDYVFPASHDFEWTVAGREAQTPGDHPHVNILDTVFVETVGGDLTVKVEDNTSDGSGIYAEAVDDKNQTLDDAEFQYAALGTLILLRIKPYREEAWRYLVFNTRSQDVQRIDAIGRACVQLPEDHGIIFPGGYYLQTGDHKVFDLDIDGLEFKRVVKAPNGEDVLYVFYRRRDGHYVLLPYNLIRKAVQSPIHCHGYSIFDDGRMVVFRSINDEPTRVHPVQVWQTPFVSAEHAAAVPTDGSFLAKVGNAELVRGISDALSVSRATEHPNPTRQTYEDLIGAVQRMRDAYFWIADAQVGDLKSTLDELLRTGELIVDEFEKVVALRKQAAETLAEADAKQREVVAGLRPDLLTDVDGYMRGLTSLRSLRGHLITMREVRFVDLARIDALESDVVEAFERTTGDCVRFLLAGDAFEPLVTDLDALLAQVEAVGKAADIIPLRTRTEEVAAGLDLLTEIVSGLQIDDATARTTILESISGVFAHLNRVRATVDGKRKSLMSTEGRAEFAAQYKLFGQSVSSALSMCDTPERCDAELSRLMVQLQELEARFSEFDEFLADLTSKREETYEAFGARRQTLLDERQRRVGNIVAATERITDGLSRRARTFGDADELNAFFAADGMVLKLRDLAAQLVELGDAVKADEVLSRLKTARQEALRSQRDKLELFEGDGDLIKLGNHRFSVNTQPLELTMVPRGDEIAFHLTGTDFYEPVADEAFEATRALWSQTVVSETPDVYRAEYLAATLLFADDGALRQAALEGRLAAIVTEAASGRYDEGYERGLHDHDAALILEKLLTLDEAAGLLRFGSTPRALAALYWGAVQATEASRAMHLKACNLGRLKATFQRTPPAARALAATFEAAIETFAAGISDALVPRATLAARYLVEELAAAEPRFTTSRDAVDLAQRMRDQLEAAGVRRGFEDDLGSLQSDLAGRLDLALAWVEAVAPEADADLRFEAAALVAGDPVDREPSSALTTATVPGLLGNHPRIRDRALPLRLDAFRERLTRFVEQRVPAYRAYRALRHELVEAARERLRLGEFKPRVMSSFVRNKLINDVYLPLVGDNFAKQMGAAGDARRTDLMGLLLLISPPGYGKTTLMEYVASRLGLTFVKVNGPALGHHVRSIDPGEAPNATARQEVEKINLALEMGNNVMLYLDDIQHTHPELLQKFISLCDGQRKMEGVWNGKTRTYDLRGKKFCVVMAGNPYTESGAKFEIPDMLANRADTYNLGDILEGRDEVFALSYVENSLTSNATLAPLATRDQGDVYNFVRMARGEEVPSTDLKHGYSAVEISEIVAVLERMFLCQQVVLRVNQQYIASAATDDAFRTEPTFKLQGSYRNMNKLAEKVVAVMTTDEVQTLVDDHYRGEAQTLTSGAEHNLLKLAEMRGRLDEAEAARWAEIKKGYQRIKTIGGADDDPATRVVGSLSAVGDTLGTVGASVSGHLAALRKSVSEACEALERPAPAPAPIQVTLSEPSAPAPSPTEGLGPVLRQLSKALDGLAKPELEVTIHNLAPPGVEELLAQQVAIIERTLVPLVKTSLEHLGEARAVEDKLDALLAALKRADVSLRD